MFVGVISLGTTLASVREAFENPIKDTQCRSQDIVCNPAKTHEFQRSQFGEGLATDRCDSNSCHEYLNYKGRSLMRDSFREEESNARDHDWMMGNYCAQRKNAEEMTEAQELCSSKGENITEINKDRQCHSRKLEKCREVLCEIGTKILNGASKWYQNVKRPQHESICSAEDTKKILKDEL